MKDTGHHSFSDMRVKKQPVHLFYAINSTSPKGPFTISAGHYGVSKGFLYRQKITSDEEEWLDNVANIINALDSESSHILVYIHGFLAENPWFASLSGYRLHKEIFDLPIHDVNVVLSLLWDSGLNYGQNRQLATEKGRQFRSVVEKLNQRAKSLGKQPAFSFLLHSMGNIVFEGLVEGIKKENKLWHTRQVFCCAADLKSDVFDGGLQHVPEIAGDVHVLFHAEDKTLRVANMIQRFRRLGIYGREDENKAKNIHSLDATFISGDDMAVGSRFSHHRYFYGSKKVVNYINKWLSTR